ncbi:uncharacterized protein BP5553_05141 [Venustampulla echinocandica]|uniref:Uncharacterized protein n=1 Tax=Venustampulla echinocandica TaxID=2656787 RepID=A0A370TQC8_9HELO|nr:uncharacterized protein BP5553_05141 [Venustampulla echinocandica]RDL37708.1 hypothetical protein BP5553_05141 [Venustampulla echinocandica]
MNQPRPARNAAPTIIKSSGRRRKVPVYYLMYGDIIDSPIDAITVVTDGRMRVDRQALAGKKRSGGEGSLYNAALLVNLQTKPPGSNRTLRLCIHRILRRAVTKPRRPHDPEWSDPNEEPDRGRYPELWDWWRTPRSIAFGLIGSGDLGYGYSNAAEQILGMIVAWYNHPTKGRLRRRRQILHVYLMIPQSGPMSQRRLVRKAWEQAWK